MFINIIDVMLYIGCKGSRIERMRMKEERRMMMKKKEEEEEEERGCMEG
ncbi:MAG: hypothetical protein ACK4FV_01180 [Candidatus Nitrosocaldus sp.]